MDDGIKLFLLILLVAFLIFIGPIAIIWSLNHLFALGLAYTFKTWLAVFLLAGVFKTKVNKN